MIRYITDKLKVFSDNSIKENYNKKDLIKIIIKKVKQKIFKRKK